jgi:hypothetical protein
MAPEFAARQIIGVSAWIFHELRSRKIGERGRFTLVDYVEWQMILPAEQALQIQPYRLAQR